MKNPKILWLVAARSGSKSVPNKNIKLLKGRPLLDYRIKSAIKSGYNNSVWISTDSQEYAEIAKASGAKVKFLRPNDLASDDSSSVDVVLHAMKYAEEHSYSFDFIGLLEPTSPFITAVQLDQAIARLISTKDARSIVSVVEHRPNTLFVQKEAPYLKQLAQNIEGVNKVSRQEFEKEITPSGGFYISRWESFLSDKSFYTEKTVPFLVDEISGLEIDHPIDFLFAEFIADGNHYQLSK